MVVQADWPRKSDRIPPFSGWVRWSTVSPRTLPARSHFRMLRAAPRASKISTPLDIRESIQNRSSPERLSRRLTIARGTPEAACEQARRSKLPKWVGDDNHSFTARHGAFVVFHAPGMDAIANRSVVHPGHFEKLQGRHAKVAIGFARDGKVVARSSWQGTRKVVEDGASADSYQVKPDESEEPAQTL